MDVKPMFLAVGLIAILLMFGCTMPNLNNKQQNTTTGYTISVNPRTIVPGGVSTIKFTIENDFARSMKDVTVTVGNIPGDFQVQYNSQVGDILKGEKRPQIITVTAPDSISMQEVLTPKITVCFDYTTDFYQDIIFNSLTSTANVTAHSGYTPGPVSISLSNYMMYPKAGNKGVTSIQITNTYQGHIEKINSINVQLSNADYINGMSIDFYGCSKNANSGNPLSATISNCNKLSQKTIVENGAQGTITINFDKSVENYDLQRLSGSVDYTYCYDVNVGTITVKPVGVQ